MKSNAKAAHCDGSSPLPVEIPPRTGARPVRQGRLWPGESYTGWTHEWNLAGALIDRSFVLPAFATGRDPQLF